MKVHNVIRNHPLFEGYNLPIMELITGGSVRINGKRRRTNRDVIVHRDTIEVLINDVWTVLEPDIKRTVVLLYKPTGYICTHNDVLDRPKIYDLVPEEFRLLRSAGRLDQDSEGLMALTDDGYHLFSLISPKFGTEKKYLVGLKQPLKQEFIEEAASGEFTIYRDGKAFVLKPVEVNSLNTLQRLEFKYLNLESTYYWYQFMLHEGKYRQIRKMCDIYSNPVQRLIRIQHGEYKLTEELFLKKYLIHSLKN